MSRLLHGDKKYFVAMCCLVQPSTRHLVGGSTRAIFSVQAARTNATVETNNNNPDMSTRDPPFKGVDDYLESNQHRRCSNTAEHNCCAWCVATGYMYVYTDNNAPHKGAAKNNGRHRYTRIPNSSCGCRSITRVFLCFYKR